MTCTSKKCEYTREYTRGLTTPQKPEEILHALLWAEIELPKLLGHKPSNQ